MALQEARRVRSSSYEEPVVQADSRIAHLRNAQRARSSSCAPRTTRDSGRIRKNDKIRLDLNLISLSDSHSNQLSPLSRDRIRQDAIQKAKMVRENEEYNARLILRAVEEELRKEEITEQNRLKACQHKQECLSQRNDANTGQTRKSAEIDVVSSRRIDPADDKKVSSRLPSSPLSMAYFSRKSPANPKEEVQQPNFSASPMKTVKKQGARKLGSRKKTLVQTEEKGETDAEKLGEPVKKSNRGWGSTRPSLNNERARSISCPPPKRSVPRSRGLGIWRAKKKVVILTEEEVPRNEDNTAKVNKRWNKTSRKKSAGLIAGSRSSVACDLSGGNRRDWSSNKEEREKSEKKHLDLAAVWEETAAPRASSAARTLSFS